MADSSKHFSLHQLADGIYAAIAKDGGAAICNAGMIDLGGELVVFDSFLTPQAAMDLRRSAEELFGQLPGIIVNSHYHNDHSWGNQAFVPEAQIVASERTRDLMLSDGRQELDYFSANAVQRLESLRAQYQNTGDEDERDQLSLWIGYYEGLVEALPHLRVCLPGITFNSSLKLHGVKRCAELITFEGGHTGSDTVLYLPQDGVIFMSDLLFVGCHPYLADGNPHQLLKALKELSQLDATSIVPGHGPVGAADDLKLMTAYVEECLATAESLTSTGSVDEGRIEALAVPEQYKHWQQAKFYLANLQFLCQLLKPAN